MTHDAIDKRFLRDCFGAFMTGVTVVTSRTGDGTPVGFTANSFTSLSLDPPLLLVCPSKALSSFPVFESCTHFAVNVLADDQRQISNTFASGTGDRFASIDWSDDANGCPLIADCAASFSCTADQRIDGGDHMILIGRITAAERSHAAGLGYCDQGYFSLDMERRAAGGLSRNAPSVAGAVIEHNGHVLLEQTPSGMRPPQVALGKGHGALATLQTQLRERGLQVDFGPVFSLFNGEPDSTFYTYYRANAETSEAGDLGQYVPLSSLSGLTYVSSAVERMMVRYAEEHESGRFGLYVGDDEAGDVHPISEGVA